MHLIIGIDPGKNGAIVKLCGSDYSIYKIPLIKNIIDVPKLIQILKPDTTSNISVFIEEVHAIFGSSAGATFSFGYTCGLLEGIVSSLGIPYNKVQPKTWQKVMFEGIPKIYKPKKPGQKRDVMDTKAMALVAAQRIFPNVCLKKSDRCKNHDDGIVDALLIACYGSRHQRIC